MPELLTWRHVKDLLFVAAVGGVDLLVWSTDPPVAGAPTPPPWAVPAMTAGMAGVLLLRHRHPLGVFAAQWCYPFITLVLPDYQPFAALLVALYAVAAKCPAATARPAALVCAVPFGLFSYRFAELAEVGGDLQQFLWAGGVYAVALGVVFGLGRLMHAREQQAAAEQERLRLAAERALEAERMRLAHELHDSVSGTVAGMILRAAGAKAVVGGGDRRVHDALEVIEKAGQQAMNELHRMLGLLRTADLGPDQRTEQPRFAELQDLVERARRSGNSVDVDVDGDPRPLDPSVDLAAYRIVQESLTNVAKHAGTSAVVRIGVQWRGDGLHLEVASRGGDGPPAEAQGLSSGHGLRGLRERVELVGGSLASGPVGQGWLVRAELPVADAGPSAVTGPATADGSRRPTA